MSPPSLSTASPAYDLTTGVVDLRPLRFTDVLDGAFAVYRSSMRVVIPLVLAVMVPLQLLSAFLQRDALRFGLTGILDDPAATEALLGQGGLTPGIIATLAGQVVVAPLLAGALAVVALARTNGRTITAGQAARTAIRRGGWLVGAYVLGLLARGAPLLLVVVGVVAGSPPLVAAGTAVAIPLALAMTPLLAVITPALVAEDRPGPDAIAHAVRLAARSWWRVAGVVVGTSVVFNLVAVLLAGIPNVLGLLDAVGFSWVLVGLANVLAQLVTAPLTAAAMVLLHTDLRMRQEGLDFDVLLARLAHPHAAGGRPPPAGCRPGERRAAVVIGLRPGGELLRPLAGGGRAVSPIVLAQLPDPDLVRQTTQDVLSQPEYARVADGPTVIDRVLQAIAEQLGRLLLRFDGEGGAGSVVAALVLVGVILALVVALVVFLRRIRRGSVTAAPLEGAVGRPAADWGAEADQHEQAGRWREAMRCRYREAIAAMAAAALVDEIPGRTTGEYRRAVQHALPAATEPFGEMTDRFDRAWYGGAAVDADDLTAFTASHRRVQQAIPRSRRRPEAVGR